ncbi:MAG: SH3 domain-containing protein [bacterium]|nr:SH3 domain-containing protein [bacterium]
MRTKLVLLVVALFMSILAFAAPAMAQDQPVAYVNTAFLNVRSGPGLGFGAVATLPQGFGVNLLGRNEEGNWVLIGFTNGAQGWANINYLYTETRISTLSIAVSSQGDPVPAAGLVPTATINSFGGAQLLSGPNENNPVIGFAPQGASVVLVGRSFNSEWALVRLSDGLEGWVLARAIASNVPLRSVSPADGSVFAPPPPSNAGPGGNAGTITYVIQPGDTLFSIAQRYGVNVYDIAALNNIYNINLIYYGMTLHIPRT